ncbi:hypothetical protein B0T09DRAFT_330438 [Sordaria sp. MPI-SDFR-AT-0083]|nr:hypothetical protein B0T09DRAFT_330438 [Sordaria sp. MPI-SDFR-AT-0083]
MLSFASPLLVTLVLLLVQKPVQVSAATPIAFINPPPFRQEDNSKNVVYKIGSTMRLQWTEDTEVRSSLVLYQIPGDGAFEYVAPNHVQITDYDWIVNTAKNLSSSNVFQLAIFFNGSTTPNAMSSYFNITAASSSSSPNLSAGSLPVTTSASVLDSTAAVTTAGTGAGTAQATASVSTPTPPASTDAAGIGLESKEDGKKGLSTSAAIGIGIGVSAAVFLLIAGAFAYWILKVRPRRNFNNGPLAELPQPQTPHNHMAMSFGGSTTMVMTPDNAYAAGNGNGNNNTWNGNAANTAGSMYQTKDIFGGELQGNGPGRGGGTSVYEIGSSTGSAFAWDRARRSRG